MAALTPATQITNFNAFQDTDIAPNCGRPTPRSNACSSALRGPGRGEAEYHAFKTRLANNSSMRSIQYANPDYCHEASQVGLAGIFALGPAKPVHPGGLRFR